MRCCCGGCETALLIEPECDRPEGSDAGELPSVNPEQGRIGGVGGKKLRL